MNIDLRIATVTVLLIAKRRHAKAPRTRARKHHPPRLRRRATACRSGRAARLRQLAAAPTTDPLVAHADSARIRGNPAAKVWMILASDFQCPYCKMWHDSSDLTIQT